MYRMMYLEPLSQVYAAIQPLNRPYFSHSVFVKINTAELRNPVILAKYISEGFIYIRRLHYKYHHILREPTNGCYVELTKEKDIGSLPIESAAARKLIRRISYF
jgi:hypothetical protein